MPLHWKWNPWCKFPKTSPRTPWRRGGLWSWIDYKTQKARTGISIPPKMERLSAYWCNMGIWIGIFRWWQHVSCIQRLTPTLTKKSWSHKRKANVLPLSLPSASVWNLPGVVQRWLEKSHPMRPRTPEWMCLFGVNLCHPPPAIRQCFRLVIWRLYSASKQHSAQNFGYKANPPLQRGIIDSPSIAVIWLNKINKICPSLLFSTPILTYPLTLFAVHTLPFDKFSFVLDLLTHDNATTQNLLVLDRINQTIVGLEQQLDENHRLATQHFSTLLWRQAAQHLPQQIHDAQNPDCGRCWLRCRQPTPFQRTILPSVPSSSSSSSSPSSSTRRRCRRMPPYPRPSHPIPSTSATTKPLPFPPLTTCSGWVYSQNYFEANAEDCLCRLQTIPQERRWGTSHFLIVVEAPDAEDNIFQRYYQWFINKGWD